MRLAVLRQQPDAAPDRVARRLEVRVLALERVMRAGCSSAGAGEEARQLRLPAADQAGDAEHLACVQIEVDVSTLPSSVRPWTDSSTSSRRPGSESGLLRRAGRPRRSSLRGLADHRRDDVGRPAVGGVERRRAGRRAARSPTRRARRAHPCDGRCRGASRPGAASVRSTSKSRSTSGGGKRRGGLVEQQHAGLLVQRLGEFDRLLLGDRDSCATGWRTSRSKPIRASASRAPPASRVQSTATRPVCGRTPRKMFSATESCGTRLSSW